MKAGDTMPREGCQYADAQRGEAPDLPLEKLYTPEEVAEYLALSPITIKAYLRTGKLEGLRVGGHWRVKESALEAFVAAQEAATPEEREAASRQAYGAAKKRAGKG